VSSDLFEESSTSTWSGSTTAVRTTSYRNLSSTFMKSGKGMNLAFKPSRSDRSESKGARNAASGYTRDRCSACGSRHALLGLTLLSVVFTLKVKVV
jgi:hypothetical protein